MNEPDNIAQRKMQFLFALRSKGVTDARVLTAMEKIDRGPFIRNRVIDLSKGAAQEIGMIRAGVANVRVVVLDEAGRASAQTCG